MKLFMGICMVWSLTGCPADGSEVRPPQNEFYFPTGLTATPGEESVIVVNSNFDLRYDSATVQLIDAGKVASLVDAWRMGGVDTECSMAADINGVMQCPESAVLRESGVRIGNFATTASVQTLDSGDYRVFLPVRGDPSLTWMDYDVGTNEISCSDSATFGLCDREHQMLFLQGDSDLGVLQPEPFQLFMDSNRGYGLATHLATPAVTLFNSPSNGDQPEIVDILGGLFATGGLGGTVGVAGHPGYEPSLLYVTSQLSNQVRVLYVKDDGSDPSQIVLGETFEFDAGAGRSDDSRAIVFRDDGNRAYALNRSPPLLHILDTSIDDVSFPKNELIGAVEICARATALTNANLSGRERVFVSCFNSGEVWVIDPERYELVSTIATGRGPSSLAILPNAGLLFVANAQENTVSVVDVDPESATNGRFLLRVGTPVGVSQ